MKSIPTYNNGIKQQCNGALISTVPKPSTNIGHQAGIGLIEVIVALLVFTFTALSIGHSNTISLGSSRTAGIHGNVNLLAHEMLEILKADRLHAADNSYDIAFDADATDGSGAAHVDTIVTEWRSRIQAQLPNGESQIACEEDNCTVSLRWTEISISEEDTQTYNLKSSL